MNIVLITGPAGSGKTTVARAIMSEIPGECRTVEGGHLGSIFALSRFLGVSKVLIDEWEGGYEEKILALASRRAVTVDRKALGSKEHIFGCFVVLLSKVEPKMSKRFASKIVKLKAYR